MTRRFVSIVLFSLLVQVGVRTAFAQAPFVRTKLVTAGGTPTANGTALMNALTAITTNSSTNPWLVKIETGIFDLGSASLNLKDYVDIEGSGKGLTVITSTAPRGSTNNGVVDVASGIHTELRNLTVQDTGTTGDTICITNISNNFSLNRVNLANPGGSGSNFGLLTEASNPTINEVNVQVASQNTAIGIWVTNGSPQIKDTTITLNASAATAALTGIEEVGATTNVDRATIVLAGGNTSYGIFVVQGQPTVSRSSISVTAAATANVVEGIRTFGSTALLQDLNIAVSGASSTFGIVLDGGDSAPTTANVLRSVISASGTGVATLGIYLDELVNATLSQVQVSATGSSQASAVYADFANGFANGQTVNLFDSMLSASGGTANYGINVTGVGDTFLIVGTTSTAATGTSYALTEASSGNTFKLDHSQMIGGSGSVNLLNTFSAGGSQLAGTVGPSSGVCVASYDGSYVALPSNCL